MGLGATFYQNGIAVVRDTRRIDLPSGRSRLAFADLLPTLRPKSAILIDAGQDVQAVERNYEFDLLSPGSLLKGSLGRPAWIHDREGKWDRSGFLASLPLLHPAIRADADPLARIARLPRAFVQAIDPQVVVFSEGGYRPAPPEELAFPGVPRGLRPSPTLLQDIIVPSRGARDLTLVYSATNLSWTASYIATLDPDCRHLDLAVFATVENGSDGPLPDAALQLVAGEPNLVQDDPPRNLDEPRVDMTTTVECVPSAAAGPPAFKEEKLTEYPLFSLDRPVSISAHSKKQLLLMQIPHVPLAQSYVVETPYQDYAMDGAMQYLESETFKPEPTASGASPVPCLDPDPEGHDHPYPLAWNQLRMNAHQHDEWLARHFPPVQRIARIRNSRENGLGRALPGGNLDVRYRDPMGLEIPLTESMGAASQFPVTPPGTDIELALGPMRGLRVERRPTRRRVVHTNQDGRAGEHLISWIYTLEVKVSSRLATGSTVTIREPVYADWTLMEPTHPGTRSGTNALDFTVKVPARGKAILRYTVKTNPEPAPNEDPSE